MPDVDLNSRLFLTLDEVAELLLVSRRTVEREISKNRFPLPVKVGGRFRVPVGSFREYLKSLHVPTARDPFIATFSGPNNLDIEILNLIKRQTAKTPPPSA